MATFHQNLVQSFTNFKNKYMRSYDTWADAQADIANIPEGGRFFTKDGGSNVPINARNVRYDDGTQAGSDVETQIAQINADLADKPNYIVINGTTGSTLNVEKEINFPSGVTSENYCIAGYSVHYGGDNKWYTQVDRVKVFGGNISCYVTVTDYNDYLNQSIRIMLLKIN